MPTSLFSNPSTSTGRGAPKRRSHVPTRTGIPTPSRTHSHPSSSRPASLVYPSPHGAGAGAAGRILWKACGRHHTVTNSHPSVPGVVLTYDDLLDIEKDVSNARVYGGIHFRTDQDAAEHQGKSVAQWNLDNQLRPKK
jgi:hypothetical protein